MATVYERLKKIIIEQLGVDDDKIHPQASFVEDFNADSLDLVELIMAIEEEFSGPNSKLVIPDEDAEKIKTVQNAMDYLKDSGIAD